MIQRWATFQYILNMTFIFQPHIFEKVKLAVNLMYRIQERYLNENATIAAKKDQ